MRRAIPGLVATVLAAGAALAWVTAEGYVSYRDYRVAVPAGWEVVDLEADPGACVRFDRPAIYIGQPGDQANCSSALRGRTAGLIVEPLEGAASPVADPDMTRVVLHDKRVVVTGIHTASTKDSVLRLMPSGLTNVASAQAMAVAPQPGTFTGRGFDTCAAPSQSTMNTWRNSSPYRAVGIYISGASRSCSQPNLTATWVTNQTNNGWRLIPIELDNQAPCGTRTPKMSSDPGTARSQGASRATSAVNAAKNLGIPAGSTIYNDIEHYPSNASCRAAVLSYLSGWTDRLHALGYLSGMYSSGSSGVADVCGAYHDTRYTRLDHLWFAWWNGVANTDAGSYCADEYYANHQRLHQYAGDVYETWGGVQMRIDRDYLDVAPVGSEPPPPTWTSIVDNTDSGRFTASANWGTSAFSSQRYGADYRYANPVSASDAAWYKFNIPATASYEISVWYPANSGYNDSTPFIIAATSGNQTVRVNQRINGGQWLSLGVFTLAAGDGDKVGVSRWTSGTGYVIADAVRITRV